MLEEAIRRKKQESDVKVFAKEFTKELAEAISPDEISRNVENKIMSSLEPLLNKLIERDQFTVDSIERAIVTAIQNVRVEVPEIVIPDIVVPRAQVNVSVPQIKVPDIVMPDEMNVKGFVSLMGIDLNNPLPVQLRDAKGNPVKLFENLTSLVAGASGGGKSDFFTIKGFTQSAFAELMNADGRVKVELPAGGSGLTDTELRASSVPVAQASGALWSTAVVDIFGSTAASSVFNADNRIKVSVETGGSGLTDAELRASSVPVAQASGANWSTSVTNTVTVSATDLDIRDLVNSTDSISAYQVSGHRWSTEATQSGTWTVALSGSLSSSVVVGPTAVDVADGGNAPVQVGGIARTANPTAVAGGDVVKTSHDDIGRVVTRPIQVRDLISTAYVSLTTGTETTLLAGVAGSYLDLVYVMGTNNSDAAVTVDIRAVTAGNVQTSIRIPANGTAGVALPVPIPQDETGNAWTCDLPDITGTTVTVSALFSREV